MSRGNDLSTGVLGRRLLLSFCSLLGDFFPVLLELGLHCRYSMGLGTHDELVVLYILTIREPPNGFYLLQKETALMRGENYTYL